MKIIQYLHTKVGGHRRYVMELAEALQALEDVVVITAHGAPDSRIVRQLDVIKAPDLSKLGARRILDRIWVYLGQPRAFERAALAELKCAGSDVCHFQELPSLFPSRIVRAARRAGYRTVITIHNVSPHETSGVVSLLMQSARIRAWRSADLLIVHSDNLSEELIRTARVSPGKITVVHHPIWAAGRLLRVEHPSGYLFFGHLREAKGLPLFIEALGLLGNPRASIVGSGSDQVLEAVRTQLAALKLTNCTFTPGFANDADVPKIFSQHSVLVAPYLHFQAQSGVTHLAAAHGLATVVTAVGGLPDLVREYGIGEIASPEPASLAAAMLKAHDKASRGEYDSGFARSRLELAPGAVARQLVDAYRRGQ